MTENKWISRYEYREKIQDLVASGKLPKSYKSTVSAALEFVAEPREELALAIYERYRNSIPNVPADLRAEMDKLLLNKLVSDKRLSAVSRDVLLGEFAKIKFHHNKTSVDLKFEEAMQEFERIDRSHKETVKKMQEAEKRAPFEIAAVLSAIAIVVVMAWSAFANWVNSQPHSYRQSDEKNIPGLGITASEYQRRSDCLNLGC